MKKLLSLMLLALMLSNVVLHCKTRLTVVNNTDEKIEISFKYGAVYFELDPHGEIECIVGDTFCISTPFGVAAGYYSDNLDEVEDTTVELNENTYFLGEEERYYWREGE